MTAKKPSIWRVLPWLPVVLAIGVGVAVLMRSTPTAAAPPEIEAGRRLFATQCAGCHGTSGNGVTGRGPSLLAEGPASADFVLRTGRMPLASPAIQATRGPVRYSEAEITALVAYVGSIGGGPGIPTVDISTADVTRGGKLYRLNCAACHVASGAGAPMGGGRHAPNLLAASPTEIAEAILVGPGSMPVFGSFTNAEATDVAAYIDALADQKTSGPQDFGGAGPAAEGLAAWLLALVPLVALTRWIGEPNEGRDHAGTDPDQIESKP